MMAFLSSAVMYIFMISLGYLFNFTGKDVYVTVLIYMIVLMIIKPFYKNVNCKPIEVKDFMITGIVCLIQLFFMKESKLYDKTDIYFYLYLSTFLPYISYVSSLRYKSLN